MQLDYNQSCELCTLQSRKSWVTETHKNAVEEVLLQANFDKHELPRQLNCYCT